MKKMLSSLRSLPDRFRFVSLLFIIFVPPAAPPERCRHKERR